MHAPIETEEQTSSSPLAIEMSGVGAERLREPGRIVAENVNWTVARGDYWVIGGLHGSGKSDFLAMAAGLMPPSGGRYRLLGNEMPIFDDARLHERLRLGLVFENGQLFNQLTVFENVALPLRYHRNLSRTAAQEEVAKLLELTELTPWADNTPSNLGRNWQRRAGLARALILRPEILVLDNPLAGLDPRQTYWWLDFLDKLSKGQSWLEGRPMTLVVSAADLQPWRGRARQVAVLKNKQFDVLGDWEHAQAKNGWIDGLVD